MFALSKFDIQY
jgi:hypothetical protein